MKSNKPAYLDTLPMPGAPRAAPHCCNTLLARVPTTSESGRYNAIRRSIDEVTFPPTNSTITESWVWWLINAFETILREIIDVLFVLVLLRHSYVILSS